MKLLFKLFFVLLLLYSGLNVNASQEYLLRGDFKDAYINFNQALEKDKTALNYLNMCRITFSLNDSKMAKYYCNRAIDTLNKEKNHDNELESDILSMLGDIYSNVYHNTDITFDYYNQAKEKKESNPETDRYELAKLYLNMGNSYRGMGEYYLAKEFLDKSINIVNEKDLPKYRVISSMAYNYFGLMEKDNKNYEKAGEYFETALKELDKALVYKNSLLAGNISENLGDYYENYAAHKNKSKAQEYYNQAKLYYDSPIKLNENNQVYQNILKLNEAETKKEVKRLIKEYPYDISILTAVIYYNLMEGDEKEAQNNIDKLINTYGKSAYAYLYTSIAYAMSYYSFDIEKKELAYLQRSNDYLKIYLKKSGNNPEKYYFSGLVNFYLGKLWNAQRYFNTYMEKTPYSDTICTNIAKMYMNLYDTMESYKNALKYYELSLKKGNKNLEDIYNLWTIYNKLGYREKAFNLNKKYNISSYNSDKSDDVDSEDNTKN